MQLTFSEYLFANSRYALGKKLGEGAFGQVRLATEITTKKDTRIRTSAQLLSAQGLLWKKIGGGGGVLDWGMVL